MKRRCGAREIAYDDVGGGPALVLLHPFPFDRRYWAATVPALADGWRVLAVDARGFGESEASGPFTIADLADDLAALLDGLGVPTAAVVGL
jgi:pimeloyl-ACP methyl ester carboxylesterase